MTETDPPAAASTFPVRPDSDVRPRTVHARRRGRLTVAQARGLEYFDDFNVADGANLTASFGRSAPVALEIGFGMGQALVDFASTRPDWNCIGVDVYRPGIGSLIHQCRSLGLTNVRIAEQEALTFVESLNDASLSLVMVFFPDPWPKKRHHKRRLINDEFTACISRKLIDDGELLIATDWAPYAEDIGVVLDRCPALRGAQSQRPDLRPVTRFEARGERLGHEVFDFAYRRG